MTACEHPPADDRCKYSEDAARLAVKQVFSILGVDVDDPKEVEEFRKDLRFGQMMRKASDRGFMAVAVLVCTALAVTMWAGITSKFGGH